MIVPGTATVNENTGKVELTAPLGFGAVAGLRLSNFSGDSLILTNISGQSQDQQYLAPQTQMVYKSTNVGVVPSVVGYAAPPEEIAANLLVEWSTDPESDFIGTYPTGLPAAITTTGGTSQFAKELPGNVHLSTPINVGIIPGKTAFLAVQIGETAPQATSYSLLIYELQAPSSVYATAGALLDLNESVVGTFCVPFSPSHVNDTWVAVLKNDPSAADPSSIALSVYSLTNSTWETIPPNYVDVPFSLQYEATGPFVAGTEYPLTPVGSTPVQVALGWLQHAGQLDISMTEKTTVTGDKAQGYIQIKDATPADILDPIIATPDLVTLPGASGDLLYGTVQRNWPTIYSFFDETTLNFVCTASTDPGATKIVVTITQTVTLGNYNFEGLF